jgi:hypothetical protein
MFFDGLCPALEITEGMSMGGQGEVDVADLADAVA